MVQNNYNYSGTFEVEECKILTHHGEPLDLVQALVAISAVSYTHLRAHETP